MGGKLVMKDPYTMIASWWRFTLWHRDRNGVDGACGWTYPHLTKEQGKSLDTFAWCESRERYFLRCPGKRFNGPRTEAEALYRALVLQVARAIDLPLTLEEATRVAIYRVHHGHDIFTGAETFCFVPGYHTNFSEDLPEYRQQHFSGIVCGLARSLLADYRPWYKHPCWHVHHWRLRFNWPMWWRRLFKIRPT